MHQGQLTLARETADHIARNLGITHPENRTVPELRAAIFTASARVAPIANRTH